MGEQSLIIYRKPNPLPSREHADDCRYGEVETLPEASKYTTSIYMHGWDNPLGIFRFKYRSRSKKIFPPFGE